MDWDKAKYLTIIFLFILNLFLGTLVFVNSKKYVLSNADQNAIRTVMSKNNVILYTQILKEYKPMRNLKLSKTPFKNVNLTPLLADESSTSSTLNDESEFLTKTSNSFEFRKHYNNELEFSNKHCLEISNYYVSKFNLVMPNLFLDRTLNSKEKIVFEYRQKSKNQIIHSNYMIFTFTENEGLKIECHYDSPVYFQNILTEISPPNEALYVVMQYINNVFWDKKTFINKMDIVYFYENDDGEIAIPYYRFYTSESEHYFLVNAYTSTMNEIE
jgi:hypothetical protein